MPDGADPALTGQRFRTFPWRVLLHHSKLQTLYDAQSAARRNRTEVKLDLPKMHLARVRRDSAQSQPERFAFSKREQAFVEHTSLCLSVLQQSGAIRVNWSIFASSESGLG